MSSDRKDIFISYRRKGGNEMAGQIADNLKNRGYYVFPDKSSFRHGRFDEQLLQRVDECRVFLPDGAGRPLRPGIPGGERGRGIQGKSGGIPAPGRI